VLYLCVCVLVHWSVCLVLSCALPSLYAGKLSCKDLQNHYIQEIIYLKPLLLEDLQYFFHFPLPDVNCSWYQFYTICVLLLDVFRLCSSAVTVTELMAVVPAD
jgi:hypothetical protein